MNKEKTNDIKLLGTLNNADESGIIGYADQIYDPESKTDVSQRISNLDAKVATQVRVMDNIDGYILAFVDQKNVVLGGILTSGNWSIPRGIPDESRAIMEKIQAALTEEIETRKSLIDTHSSTYLWAITDANHNIWLAGCEDGTVIQPKGIPDDVKKILDNNEQRLQAIESFIKLAEASGFLGAFIDANNNRLLSVLKNGNFEVANDILSQQGYSLKAKETVADTLYHIVDHDGKLLFNIHRNGKITVGNGVVIDGLKSGLHIIDSQGWLFAIVDNENNVLCGIDTKGALFANSIRGIFTAEVIEDYNYVLVFRDANGNILFGITNKGEFVTESVRINGVPTTIDSPEFLYAILDSQKRVLWGIFKSGEIYQPKGIPEEQVIANDKTEKRLSKIENLLESGELKTKIDWSDKSIIYIPTPRYAVMNITGISRMPWAKGINLHAWVEFWDMNGNYFKKRAIMNAQGNSSMGFIKKNFEMDFCNDVWEGDDTPTIKIGDWVGQDSFHCKAYYTDFFRGVGVVAYQLFEQIVKTRGNMKDKPWKKALINMDAIGTTTKSFGNVITDDMELQTDTGALCHPDGFPVMVYFEGDFYGVFSFQLKKHRDNYHFSKKKVKHIHLDGDLYGANLWNGTVGWSHFEIRNPKALVYAVRHNNVTGGYKYDADIAQDEIAGTDKNYVGTYASGTTYTEAQVVDMDFDGDTEYFICTDPELANINAPTLKKNTYDDPDYKGKTGTGWLNCTGSVKVKASIQKLAGYMTTLNNLAKITTINGDITLDAYGGTYDKDTNFGKGVWVLSGGKYYMSINSSNIGNALTDTGHWLDVTETVSNLKSTFESMFDIENLIDYLICSDLTKNTDGFGKNWQWFTYNAKKWFDGIYDCDMSFGGYFQGNQITDVTTYHLGNSTWLPTGWIIKLYSEELKARYKELADLGIITADNIFGKLREWQMRIGTEYMNLEYERWPDSPCNNESLVRTDYWQLEEDEDGNPKTATSETFDATKAYTVGEEVSFGLNAIMGYYVFKCVQETTALETNTAHAISAYSPIKVFRHVDNLYRAEKWINQQVKNMDVLYSYNR